VVAVAAAGAAAADTAIIAAAAAVPAVDAVVDAVPGNSACSARAPTRALELQARRDADNKYLRYPSSEDYERMNHSSLVELIQLRDHTVRHLRQMVKVLQKQQRLVEGAIAIADARADDWYIARCGKWATTGHPHVTP
jgi:hypothetical protein